MLQNCLVVIYAAVVTFVLMNAERNRREMRPHGRALTMMGKVALSASCTMAVLFGGWALLHASGYVVSLPAG